MQLQELLNKRGVISLEQLDQMIEDLLSDVDNLNDEIYSLDNELNEANSLLAEYE